MIWITTPLLLALQYFGGDKDIFPFERNTKSFFVAILILVFTLPCLTYGLKFLGDFLRNLSTRRGTKSKSKDSEANRPDNLQLP
jgi:hypothetical protein